MLCCFARRLLACALFLIPALSWAGNDLTGGAPLTLADAIARTLERNPDLAVFPFARRSAEAERLQAGLLPNPELGAALEHFAGSGQARGTKALETTLTLSQLIELGGKRSRRVDVAEGTLGTLEAGYVVARLDVLTETARRVTDVAEAQAGLALAQRAIELAQQTQAAAQRRVSAGAASTAERNRAAIALTRAQLDAQRARGALDARRIALAAMWGEAQPDFGGAFADLSVLPALADFAPLAEKLKGSPEFLRFAADRRLREAELKLARAQAVPDLTVGAGVWRTQETQDNALVASLRLPLPVFNRNQGNIASADARIAQSDAERDAAFLRIRSVLYGLYQAATQARLQAQTLARDAIPQADEALTLTQRGYANGRFSFLELADVQRQVLELRQQTIAAQADAHRLDAELERLTGEPIVTGLPPSQPQPKSGDFR